MKDRRSFFRNALSTGAGVLFSSKLRAGMDYISPVRVQTPNLVDLPFTLENGVKVFHLVAEPVRQEIIPGKMADLWGFNGSSPGPTIQVTQGDRVRLVVDNHLPEATSMHWHGLEVPADMDGAPGISQGPIPPGGRFTYEFTLHQEGTYFYHSHMAMQEMIGSLGAFILHPKKAHTPTVDRDFVVMLQEYAILPNNSVPNTMSMEFNWLTMNGRSGPAVTPLLVRLGERVRIRMINLGMDHHPMHLHGNTFQVTGTEAGRIPASAWIPGNTVLVGVAQARDVEFEAKYPGNWMLHCHLPHHMMNQMASNIGPMTRGKGMPAGSEMTQGMGMLNGAPGAPTGEEYGPSLGRGLGVGSTDDQAVGNTPMQHDAGMAGMENMPGMNMASEHGSAHDVPGYPQDAFMEGPMMAMDKRVAKPENAGLPAGWSGYAGGMMTFVRVLPPDQYDAIMRQIEAGANATPMSGMRMKP